LHIDIRIKDTSFIVCTYPDFRTNLYQITGLDTLTPERFSHEKDGHCLEDLMSLIT